MSIAAVLGYSTMYAKQKQGTIDGPLSLFVTPLLFKEATYGKIAPSSFAELEQYSVEEDFDTSIIGQDWDVAWFPVCWTKVGGKAYSWDGEGWDTVALTEGVLITAEVADIGTPADELLFVGVYPYTKKELDSITPTVDDGDGGQMTSPYFGTGEYIRLKGQGIGAQYFWNGDKWLAGVSDYD